MLTTRAIPVALDVWYEERRKDEAGDFYRGIAKQRDGYSPNRTTQGFYICTPSGKLLEGWNNRDTAKVARKLRGVVESYVPGENPAEPIGGANDAAYQRALPEGAVVVDVFARVLDAQWPDSDDKWQAILRSAVGRDH